MPLNERTINSARNPKWSDYDQTQIDLEVDFDELDDEYVPFTASPNDVLSWGTELYDRAVAGEFGPVADFEPPADVTGDQAMNDLRILRSEVLQNEVDPIVTNPLRWDALTAEKQQEWKDYRQAWLDITNQTNARMTFDTTTKQMEWVDVSFPTKPE